jgi:ATP synthase subunit 6
MSTVLFLSLFLIFIFICFFNRFSFDQFFNIFCFIYDFIKGILKDNVNLKRVSFFVITFFLFLTLVVYNLGGMVPYSYTLTSSFFVAFDRAFSLQVGLVLLGVCYLKKWFLNNFLPQVPSAISGPMVDLEIISFVARTFSLSIRLFANMMSGHTLLKIIVGFVWFIFTKSVGFNTFAYIPIVIIFLIISLETIIAMMQAYVFTVLFSIYVNTTIFAH